MSRSRRLLWMLQAAGASALMGIAYAAVFGTLFSIAYGTALMRGCNPNADPTPGDMLFFIRIGLPLAVSGGFVTGCIGTALHGSRSPRVTWSFAGLVGVAVAWLPLGGLWRVVTDVFFGWSALIAVSLGLAVGTAMDRMHHGGGRSTLPLVTWVYDLNERAAGKPDLRLLAVLLVGALYLLVFH